MSARKFRYDSPANAVRSDSTATPVLPTRGAQTSAGNPSTAVFQMNPTTSTNRFTQGSMADGNKNQKSVTANTDANLNEQTKIIEYDVAQTFEIEKIIGQRVIAGIVEYHVKWLGYSSDDNTWEQEHYLDCPDQIKEFLESQNSADNQTKIDDSSKEIVNMDEIVDEDMEQVEASMKNQTLGVIDVTVSNCENGYKNPDHYRHENMNEIKVANPENSQNGVMTIDISYDDDQDENKNDIILISDDEDQDTLMDVDEMVNDGNEEVNHGKEEVDDGYEEVNDGNEEVNDDDEEVNDDDEEVNDVDEEVNDDDEEVNDDNEEVNDDDEEVNDDDYEDVNDDDEEDNDPMNAVTRNTMAGSSSSTEFDCLSEEEKVQAHNSIFYRRNYDDKVASRIMGATYATGELLFLIHWAGTEYADLVPSRIANKRWPMVVIEFYEQYTNFVPPPPRNE